MDRQRDEPSVAQDVEGGALEHRVGVLLRPGQAVAACTQPGRGRSQNQDAVALLPNEGIFVVADGMGGHRRAGEAARRVASALPLELRSALRGVPACDGAGVKNAVAACGTAVSERLRAIDPDMGATVVMALVRGQRVVIAHAGDSRAYRYRDGRLTALTRDHTFVQALVDAGRLDALSAQLHPARGALLRYLGMPSPSLEVRAVRMRRADRLLLSTDGLHGLLPLARLERVLGETATAEEAAGLLLDLVAQRGGRDDATAVVVDWP